MTLFHPSSELRPIVKTPQVHDFYGDQEPLPTGYKFRWQRLPQDQWNKVVWVHEDMTDGHNQRSLAKPRAEDIDGIVCTNVASIVNLMSPHFCNQD